MLSSNSKVAMSLIRAWFLIHLALVGFGLLFLGTVMLMHVLDPGSSSSRVSIEEMWILTVLLLGFSLMYLLAVIGLIERAAWSWTLVFVVVAFSLVLQYGMAVMLPTADKAGNASIAILLLEMILALIAGIRSELSRRITAA
ncbi:MAG TPA: hypothetical protein VKD70_01305 [Candidatus Acidoferrum sp.]|nr:hypothetical protein [Candidatus Acidoferrum sp.]